MVKENTGQAGSVHKRKCAYANERKGGALKKILKMTIQAEPNCGPRYRSGTRRFRKATYQPV